MGALVFLILIIGAAILVDLAPLAWRSQSREMAERPVQPDRGHPTPSERDELGAGLACPVAPGELPLRPT